MDINVIIQLMKERSKMRDPNRIPKLLNLLQQLWEKYPDLRFFQMLNAYGYDSTVDWFHEEDDKIIAHLEKELANQKVE